MIDCIFCRIVAKELPSYTIYENDAVLAFLDIHPVHPGHTLVISKKHVPDYFSLDQESCSRLMGGVAIIGKAVQAATRADGINIGANVGVAAGQVVFHVHWHIIPRFSNDGLRLFPQKEYASREDALAMQQLIQGSLQ